MDDRLAAAVRRAQCGDDGAFDVLYRELNPVLLGYLRGMVGEDAEDVASEAWLVIARDLHVFSGDGDGFRGWAVTVARRRALDALRSRKRRPLETYGDPELLLDLPDRADTAELALESLGTRTAIELIAELPPVEAEAVLLRAVAGLDAATAAAILGKSAGAVRTAAYRGLKRLGEQLTPREAGEPARK
nr:RNA polymerase sigma factor [Streptomyces coryli]